MKISKPTQIRTRTLWTMVFMDLKGILGCLLETEHVLSLYSSMEKMVRHLLPPPYPSASNPPSPPPKRKKTRIFPLIFWVSSHWTNAKLQSAWASRTRSAYSIFLKGTADFVAVCSIRCKTKQYFRM